jgi:ADP-ribose pyrophosphatase YjhB (NUDIX family)
MHRRVAVRGIFVDDGKLLAIKHKPYMGKPVDYWCVIGGGVEPGEALIPALEREVIEETGVTPTIGRLLFIQQYLQDDKEQMELFFEITNAADYINVDLSLTSHGKDEIERIEFVDHTDPSYRILPTFLSEIDLNNLPTTTKLYNYID